MGIRAGLSDTEGVVSTFFLIRYQTIIASSREITFTRQFSSVSLVHRMETKIARKFFEVRCFIFQSKLICDACRLIAMNPTIVLTTIQNRQRGRLSVKLQSRYLAWFLIAAQLISVTYKVGNVTTIGRAPLNQIVIDNPAVSAQHAIIARSDECYRLKDLHSTNGTKVNDVPLLTLRCRMATKFNLVLS